MGTRGKAQSRYSRRHPHERCLLHLPFHGCTRCARSLRQWMAGMAYRERKEAGKVPRSIAVRHSGTTRARTYLIKEGIRHGIDHLSRVRRHYFGQSNCLRSLRAPPSRRRRHSNAASRYGRANPALLHRMRNGTAVQCSFLHVVRVACWDSKCGRPGSARATSPSVCPTASARVAHAARAKAKRARGSQMPKMWIHACHHRRAGLFDHLGFHGRRQHRKPLRQMRL